MVEDEVIRRGYAFIRRRYFLLDLKVDAVTPTSAPQELLRYNGVISNVRATLQQLVKAVKGVTSFAFVVLLVGALCCDALWVF